VRLLVDANLSPKIVAMLRDGGPDAVHVADIGMLGASDEAIMAHAVGSRQVIVSADTDFGELLAVSRATQPSVVLLRSADHLTPDQQAALLMANLPVVATELDACAVVSITRGRLRVRRCRFAVTDPPSAAAPDGRELSATRPGGHLDASSRNKH
jgi:predicted nuclease of predicted toxin-antitoxin system